MDEGIDRGRRQSFLLLGSGVLLPWIAGRAVGAAVPSSAAPRLQLSANADDDGVFRVAALDGNGTRKFELPLPARAHCATPRPGGTEAVICARRPGRFVIAFDLADCRETAHLVSPAGRHFYGHAAYSADGRTLYTTENDFEAGCGIIGIWDAADGYRRMGEFSSHGIGPHQLLLAGDGCTLIVANGGMLTTPETGRRTLNLATMQPSLAYLDAADGSALEVRMLDGERQRFLSIRHIAVNDRGTVVIALQDQGPRGERLPLVGFHRRGERSITLCAAPGTVTRRMRGYAGAAAMDSTGRVAAVSAPRGGLITLWEVENRRFLHAAALRDGCGVSPDGRDGSFLATSGTGEIVAIDGFTGSVIRTADMAVSATDLRHWDNHLTPVY